MAGFVRYNPFTGRNIIKNPDEFFGRQSELTTIFTRLQGLQSTSVYGEGKIGKSSLLYYVFHMIPSELGSNYKGVYIDIQDAKFHTVNGFLKNVLVEMGCSHEVIQESKTYSENLTGFSESIKELQVKVKPILIIDEFEHLFENPEEFNIFFWNTLRTLGYHSHVAYVIASLHSLPELCEKSKLGSTFYTIFGELTLGNFTPNDVTDFLSAKRNGVIFNTEELKLIKETSGNNPLNLRIACYHIFENRGQKWDKTKLKEKIEREIKFYDVETTRRKRDRREFGKDATDHVFKIIEKQTDK